MFYFLIYDRDDTKTLIKIFHKKHQERYSSTHLSKYFTANPNCIRNSNYCHL